MGLFCSSWGVYELIPKEKGAGLLANLKRGLVTPMMMSLILGMILGLTGIAPRMPGFLVGALDSASDCQGPVAMLLAGFVIGGYDIKGLLADIRVYIATALRLIVIPAVMVTVLRFMGTGKDILTLALIAFGTPLGLNTIVYPAAYGGETRTGASMAMISHTLSVITIPLMYLLFIEIL